MKKCITVILFSILMLPLAQSQLKLGFKAGMSYTKFTGALEENESYSFNNGFHFGITFNYYLTDIFSIKSELSYSQNGTKRFFDGPSYYIFRIEEMRFPAKDNITIDMDISNAYISIPVMASIKPLDKFEFYGGLYMGFLINPVGSGTLNFGGRFRQNMDMNFFSDEAGEYKTFPGARPIEVTILDEKRFLLPILGAYPFFDEKPKSLYKSIDYGLAGGVSYYLNPGFYVGLRFDYGLRDLTNNVIDRSLVDVENDGTLILREDSDRPFGFQVSLGFRF